MASRLGLFTILIAAIISGSAHAELPTPTRHQVEFYRTYGYITRVSNGADPLSRWERDLKRALKSNDPGPAADRLAASYGLSRENMRELVRLWLVADAFDELADARHASEGIAGELHARFVALVAASGRAKLTLQAAATALSAAGNCDAREFGPMVEGAADQVAAGWTLATSAGCSAWYGAFIPLAPEKATAPLIALADSGELKASDQLSLLAYLTGDDSLAHVAPADRPAVSAKLTRAYVKMLFDTGLADQGIAVSERLPANIRALVYGGAIAARNVQVDGLTLHLPEDKADDVLSLDLAAAYLVLGRTAEAERAFSSGGAVADALGYFSCTYASSAPVGTRDRCPTEPANAARLLFIDHLLHHQSDDPYPLAEVLFSTMGPESVRREGVWADVICRLFSELQYGAICDGARRDTVDSDRGVLEDNERSDNAASVAAVHAAKLPAYEAGHASFKTALETAAIRYGGHGAVEAREEPRRGDDPLPSRFAEISLPEAYRGEPLPRDDSWTKALAPVPDGYEPVRVERDGQRVAVISVSQNYDPTGEVSRGGYWIHFSDDGGKSWRRPLYTGLAELFPYVVLPASRLPLFDGDTLNVAVEVRELDTSSITYPPVGLRSKRHAENLYLRIPMAELTRDTNGDGLTDIAKEHLLLRPRGATLSGAPLVTGDGPQPICASPPSEQKALSRLLEKLFSVHTGAIVEPVDRDTSGPDRGLIATLAAASHVDPNSADRPIFIHGDARDFACLRTNRLMIIYNDPDLAKLQRVTPDFHAISLTPIIYDRAHDRGYIVWSTGWSGGTVRLKLVRGDWKLDRIGGWIS